MNINEAYKILGVSADISDEDLKKKHKEYVKKYHPDVYKEDPNKLKLINEAYQYVQEYRKNPNIFSHDYNQHINYNDIFSDFFGNQNPFFHSDVRRNVSIPSLSIRISFQESILGCEKNISYNREVECEVCNGEGHKLISNGCTECNGFGRITRQMGGMVSVMTCNKCFGRSVKKEICKKCDGIGTQEMNVNGKINIPPGISDNSTLRIAGGGNFAGKSNFFNQSSYTDLFVNIKVDPYKNMTLVNQDVVSELSINLLDALRGTVREVDTVYGKKTLEIKAGVKNKDEVTIPGCGVKNTKGCHRFILNVEYPSDLNKLITFLSQQEQ